MERKYPKHIYEEIRREVAVSYVHHELKKLLPSINDAEKWEEIRLDMLNWFDNTPLLCPVRDFWNGVQGFAEGFKLKSGLVSILTAENIKWERMQVEIEKVGFWPLMPAGSVMKDLKSRGVDTIGKFKEALSKEDGLWEKALKESREQFGNTIKRDADPVIFMKEENGYVANDGNGRTIFKFLEGQTHIDAYVGSFTDGTKVRKNFWIPTQYLIMLAKYGNTFYEAGRPYQHYIKALQDTLDVSESAKYEMRDRVLTTHVAGKFKEVLEKELKF